MHHQNQRGISGLNLAFTLCGTVLLVATLIVTIAFTIPVTRESLASSTWPSTSGKIVEKRLTTGTGNKNSSQLIIKYLYSVDGVELLGDRSAIGWGAFWKINKSGTSQNLGSTVKVFYNPDAPWRSTLRTGLEFNLAFFFSLVMLILGLLFTFLPIHDSRKKRRLRSEEDKPSEPGHRLTGAMLMAFGGISVTFSLVFGLVTTLALSDQVREADQTRDWTPTQARILSSEFIPVEEKGVQNWSGQIVYEYKWDDRIYTGSRYALGLGHDLEPDAKAVYQSRPDDSVTIQIDPSAPETAVFIPTTIGQSWGMYSVFMLVPACMLGCGLIFLTAGLLRFLRS